MLYLFLPARIGLLHKGQWHNCYDLTKHPDYTGSWVFIKTNEIWFILPNLKEVYIGDKRTKTNLGIFA